MDIKHKNYVCLSDLHIGARYSVLSKVDDKNRYLSAQPSECLQSLAVCFRQFVPKVFEQPPVLVLLGDCLDFDFGTMTEAADAFQILIQELFANNETQVFDTQEIIVIPGNHDHRLWQFEKDRLFINNYPDDQHYQTSKLFNDEGVHSYFLNSLLEKAWASNRSKPKVKLYYPNYGIQSPDNTHQVILHHGHFVERIYRLITHIHDLLAETILPHNDKNVQNNLPLTERLERDNGGWIDFLWSSLGMTKAAKENAVDLFNIMQDPAASHQYIQKVAVLICQYLNRHYGLYPKTKLTSLGHLTLEKLVIVLLNASFGRAFQSERMAYHSLLSASGIEGLRWYLTNSVLEQIKYECAQNSDVLPTSFVFGHTHKPFQSQLPIAGFNTPVNVYNTGGWVVDEPGLTKQQGAAAVFIDSDCQVASLRLFQDPVNDEIEPVSAQGIGNANDETNSLLARMRENLQQHQNGPNYWMHFSHNIKTAISQRAKEAREKFFDPTSNTGLG